MSLELETERQLALVKERFLTSEYSVEEAAYWDRYCRLRRINARRTTQPRPLRRRIRRWLCR